MTCLFRRAFHSTFIVLECRKDDALTICSVCFKKGEKCMRINLTRIRFISCQYGAQVISLWVFTNLVNRILSKISSEIILNYILYFCHANEVIAQMCFYRPHGVQLVSTSDDWFARSPHRAKVQGLIPPAKLVLSLHVLLVPAWVFSG